MTLMLQDGETILKESPAEHLLDMEGIVGRLYLTNLRVVFCANDPDIEPYDEEYPINRIKSVEPRNRLVIIPSGIAILFDSGNEQRFVLEDRTDWMNRIMAQKLGALAASEAHTPEVEGAQHDSG